VQLQINDLGRDLGGGSVSISLDLSAMRRYFLGILRPRRKFIEGGAKSLDFVAVHAHVDHSPQALGEHSHAIGPKPGQFTVWSGCGPFPGLRSLPCAWLLQPYSCPPEQ
jgi:hypothetical protein